MNKLSEKLCVCVCVCVCVYVRALTQSYLTLCDPVDPCPPGSSVHGDSPGKNIAGGCHALLQGIFPTQGSNPGLPHCRWILYHLSHQGSPGILEWAAYPFSKWMSWPRNWTSISSSTGRFLTSLPRKPHQRHYTTAQKVTQCVRIGTHWGLNPSMSYLRAHAPYHHRGQSLFPISTGPTLPYSTVSLLRQKPFRIFILLRPPTSNHHLPPKAEPLNSCFTGKIRAVKKDSNCLCFPSPTL